MYLHRRDRTHVRDRCEFGVLEGHHFPGIGLLNQRAQQTIVERVTRLDALELADQAVTQQVQVTDGIENLVFDELGRLTPLRRLHPLPVRQASHLLPASFRFAVTRDTLASG